MFEERKGTILLSGATMSLKGDAKFSTIATVKHALRALGQSMYQEYGPKGVHVAHVVLDGIIDSPGTRAWGGKVQLQDPADLADAYFGLHEQRSNAWSYELQLSPCMETIGMRL